MAAAPRADLKLVLNAVNPDQLPTIAAELSAVLQIDQATAMSAAQNAPIVLVGGMTQQQALCLKSHIVRLVRLGADLKLTAEPVGKVKALRWQAPPAATRMPANIFACPSCGDRFVVQRWQAGPVAQPVSQAAPAPAPRPIAAVEAQPVPEAEAVEAEAVEAEPVEAEAVAEALPAEEIAFAEPVAAPEAPPAAPEPLAFDDGEEDLLGAFAEEVAAAEADEPVEALPVEEPPPARPAPAQPAPRPVPAPAPAQPAPARPAPQPAPAPRPAPAPAPAKAAAPPAAKPAAPAPAQPAHAAKPANNGPRYDVSVAKVRGEKQERLAEIVAQRQGITFEEALKLCDKTVVVVCRGGTSADADDCRKALMKIGIKPRIRKRG